MTDSIIKDTAQKFAQRIIDEREHSGIKDQEALVSNVLAERYPGMSRAEVFPILVNNTVEKALQEIERQAKTRLINTGTLDMFGHPGFEVFEEVDGTKWEQTTIRAQRLRHEAARKTAQANKEEHQRLMLEWTARVERHDLAIERILECERLAENAGYDPEELTIEQAKKKGFAP